jgi:hypothetical protein
MCHIKTYIEQLAKTVVIIRIVINQHLHPNNIDNEFCASEINNQNDEGKLRTRE